MGMYTELYLGLDLKKDTPKELLDWLYGHNDESVPLSELEAMCPKELKDTRFDTLLCGSYYFYAQPYLNIQYDKISNSHHFTLITNLKNYSSEIEKFVALIMPYVDAYKGEHLGHYRYEEDKLPTFIVKDENES